MLFSEFIFTEKTVALKAKVRTWQEAVKTGTDLLEQKGFITAEYYQDIIKQTEKLGPYYVIGPGLALPHTSPEKGVLKSAWAFVTLDTPVNFGDEYNDPIEILITLASVSSKEHTEQGIVQIMEIFDNPDLLAAIKTVSSIEDLEQAFNTNHRPEEEN